MGTLFHRYALVAMRRFTRATSIYRSTRGTQLLFARLASHYRTAAAAKVATARLTIPHLFAIRAVLHVTLQKGR